jgi:hypothetical protein
MPTSTQLKLPKVTPLSLRQVLAATQSDFIIFCFEPEVLLSSILSWLTCILERFLQPWSPILLLPTCSQDYSAIVLADRPSAPVPGGYSLWGRCRCPLCREIPTEGQSVERRPGGFREGMAPLLAETIEFC